MVNPEHYAVALRWKRTTNLAPFARQGQWITLPRKLRENRHRQQYFRYIGTAIDPFKSSSLVGRRLGNFIPSNFAARPACHQLCGKCAQDM